MNDHGSPSQSQYWDAGDNDRTYGQRAQSNLRVHQAEDSSHPSGYDVPQDAMAEYPEMDPYHAQDRQSTMLSSQQDFFTDFAGTGPDAYGGPGRYSQDDAFSPAAACPPPLFGEHMPAIAPNHLMPVEPRGVTFDIVDPHNPHIPMSKFDNIAAVLRHRGKANARQPAYWVLDPRGKETASITWEKLTSRAEKVAQVIREKSNLYRGDRVALVYRDSEVIDFAVALLGCFLAGVAAVPINNVGDYQTLILLLNTTQSHLALTTDYNLKTFQRDITLHKLKWPTGVEWWKTNEFGSYHQHKKKDEPALATPDLAYVEFSRAPTGDLRGVVIPHRTIMHQMASISALLAKIPSADEADTLNPAPRNENGSYAVPLRLHGETIMSYLDPRQGVGLILGVLLGVYGGHTTVWLEPKTVDTPGLYAHLITRYRATVMVADYPGLKQTAYNYQQDPMATRNYKKSNEPNFSSVKICLIDSVTVDTEFHETLADRWFRPMRNPRPRDVVAPMLCLPEHGGMIISVRDWLDGDKSPQVLEPSSPASSDDEKSFVKPPEQETTDILLDKEALKTNEVVVLASGDEVNKRTDHGTLRVGSFGYPIPDATVALVDPETGLLCSPYTVGEIWVDSPSLSGGFWELPKHTQSIFHARPYQFVQGSPTPSMFDQEFLRTGLLGCIIDSKIYVLGLYEDRIRQRVEWIDHVQEQDHRYFFVQHLVASLIKSVPRIYDCTAFDAHVNGEYLPFVLVESQAASTAPTTAGGPPRQLDITFLESLSERIIEVLLQEHHLRIYCVMMTAPNQLPRVLKNGRRDIGNMLCRRDFDMGTLRCVHVKFGIERAVQNIPVGDDPLGGIWSPIASQVRFDSLMLHDKQYSGVDHREVVIDDRTSTPLHTFSNIHDLLQWRVSQQPDELSYNTIDARGREGKAISWKKFDLKVAAVAMYLRNKIKIQPGDHLLLMYTHSEEFVWAIHACIVLGAVAVPMAPVDSNRLSEDAPALLHVIADFNIRAILVNADVNDLLKQKAVAQHLKHSAQILKMNLPGVYNTTKPSKQSHGCRELGLTIRPAWVAPAYPVVVWTYWTPDQRRIAVQLGHKNIMALCTVQKETCQMSSTRPVLGCVRSTMGLGFLHTCLMGIFLATPTYLVSPVDFAGNPNLFFLALARYKIKDTYATAQMLDHAINHNAGKSTQLHELKNLMIATDQRPPLGIYDKVRNAFIQPGLDKTAINTIYSHVLNPMIASRSYMCIEPVQVHLDTAALRRGLVVMVDPQISPLSLAVHDSGMVPVSTQISIVNPETNRLCLIGEYGEVWVQSEATAHSFYGSHDWFDAERFNGRTIDGDPNVQYMRTGDLGFLHNVSRPIGPGGAMVDMQVLFVLGCIGETFEVNGLQHIPMDVEASVEKCHRALVSGGCAIFQAGSLLVLVAETRTRSFLASIVPVIVNTVLNEHQLVLDIVAFVQHGDFPRSRLGEKQRGKILASWVSRKMQTIAQFGIRDPEVEGSVGTVVPGQTPGRRLSRESTTSTFRGSIGSLKRTPGTSSSLRHVESVTEFPNAERVADDDGRDWSRPRQFSHEFSGRNEYEDFHAERDSEQDSESYNGGQSTPTRLSFTSRRSDVLTLPPTTAALDYAAPMASAHRSLDAGAYPPYRPTDSADNNRPYSLDSYSPNKHGHSGYGNGAPVAVPDLERAPSLASFSRPGAGGGLRVANEDETEQEYHDSGHGSGRQSMQGPGQGYAARDWRGTGQGSGLASSRTSGQGSLPGSGNGSGSGSGSGQVWSSDALRNMHLDRA